MSTKPSSAQPYLFMAQKWRAFHNCDSLTVGTYFDHYNKPMKKIEAILAAFVISAGTAIIVAFLIPWIARGEVDSAFGWKIVPILFAVFFVVFLLVMLNLDTGIRIQKSVLGGSPGKEGVRYQRSVLNKVLRSALVAVGSVLGAFVLVYLMQNVFLIGTGAAGAIILIILTPIAIALLIIIGIWRSE